MKEYIGTKIVKAEPAFSFNCSDAFGEWFGTPLIVTPEKAEELREIWKEEKYRNHILKEGYKVIHINQKGKECESFYTKDDFEKIYNETNKMNFQKHVEKRS